ncbi:MAG: methionyl-tRNA formyltransferase [bacterium]|nr:methionyl-tRNA formyltransferase [bacterium]
MNIVFFATPDFILSVGQVLLEAGYQIACVVTNPDRPVGRKQILTPSPAKVWAQEHNIPVLTPEKLDDNFQLSILNYQFDIFVVASYGKILPLPILNLPKFGAINIHPSLLPKYRGPVPVPAAIICEKNETGSTFLKMDEKMDHGPILYQFKSEIRPDDNADTLLHRIWKESADKLPEVLDKYLKGEIKPEVQDESKATYTRLLSKEDGFVPFQYLETAIQGQSIDQRLTINFLPDATINHSPLTIDHLIRALYPWPGVWTEIKICDKQQVTRKKRLKILSAHLDSPTNTNSQFPITNNQPPSSKLVLDQVQLEGKTPTSWQNISSSVLNSVP